MNVAETITNTYTATDECGNTATCTQVITIDDTTDPVINCPADFSVQCIEDVPACVASDATATDNCTEVTITCAQGSLVGDECGGTITNTYTATDDCGNTTTCIQIITIDDTTDPEISCPADFSVQCIEDVPACVASDAAASDNCSEVTIFCVQGALVGMNVVEQLRILTPLQMNVAIQQHVLKSSRLMIRQIRRLVALQTIQYSA